MPRSLSAATLAGLGLTLAACATTTEPASVAAAPAPNRMDAAREPLGRAFATPEAVTTPAREPQTTILPGRAALVPQPEGLSIAPGGPQDVTLDLTGAPISDAARVVLGEILNLPYTVDPALEGTITLRTAQPVTRAEAARLFEAALRDRGAALVQAGGTAQIVPLDRARQRAGGLVPQGAPGYGVEAVPLRYVAPAEIQRLVGPLAPEGAIVSIDPARNIVNIAGSGPERAALRETIALFDVDWLAGMSYALIRPANVSVDDLARELTAVLGDQGPSAGLVRFVPLPRIGTLLAVSPREQALRNVDRWVRRLDVVQGGGERRIFYRRLQNARAADVAATINAAFAGGSGAAPIATEPALDAGPDPVAAPVAEIQPEGADPEASTPPGVAGAQPRPAIAAGGGAVAAPGSLVQVVTDTPNNALVIRATPADFSAVDAVIRAMDVIPDQVLIEVTIAEVSLTDDLRFGVEWFFQDNDLIFSLSEAPAISPRFPGFNLTYLVPDTRVALSALESVTDVNVISTPRLVSLDNETATLQVGDQVPVVTQQAVSRTDLEGPIVNSVQLRDTGIVLNVTPRITASGIVFLDVSQEVSDAVATETSGIDSPTIRQRRIESRVAVRDGETVALGGLMRRSASDGRSGVPGLMDIPLLGELFSTRSRGAEKTELIVFMTPRIVRNPEGARAVTAELREALGGLQPLLQGTALSRDRVR